jgi:hypothetical protein
MNQHEVRNACPKWGEKGNCVHFIDNDVESPVKLTTVMAVSVKMNAFLAALPYEADPIQLFVGWRSIIRCAKPFDRIASRDETPSYLVGK